MTISLEDWLADEATLPEGSFVALAGDEIVGYSGLCRHDDAGDGRGRPDGRSRATGAAAASRPR